MTGRGGAPVGHLGELDEVEASSVLYLRLWCSGAEGQTQVRDDFAATLGRAGGAVALETLETFLCAAVEHGRRPLVRHDVLCSCVGADEAVIANFVAAAVSGDRDDALMIATLLVRAEMAPALTDLARQVGLTLRSLLRRSDRSRSLTQPLSSHIH